MICDRENEIDAFIPEEYWSMEAVLDIKGEKKPLIAKFYGDENGKIEIKNGEQMQAILDEVKKSDFSIESIKRGEKVKKSPLPFTTSTLQQEAAKTLNMSTKRTMNIAQQLYEGVDIKGRGTVGLITYLRTDSTRVADEAKVSSREYISENYGDNYIPKEINAKKDDKKIQDAHEAIRPTDLNLSPTVVKESLQRDQFRLYQLIWKRFVASQMAPAVYETTSVRIAEESTDSVLQRQRLYLMVSCLCTRMMMIMKKQILLQKGWMRIQYFHFLTLMAHSILHSHLHILLKPH